MEVRQVSRCRFHTRYLRRSCKSGDGDIEGRERYSSRAQIPIHERDLVVLLEISFDFPIDVPTSPRQGKAILADAALIL